MAPELTSRQGYFHGQGLQGPHPVGFHIRLGAEQNQKGVFVRNLEQETQTWPNQPQKPEKEKKKPALQIS